MPGAGLNGDQCGEEIVTALKGLNTEITGANEAVLKEQWQTIMTTIFNHIKTNGKVTVTGVQGGAGTADGSVL